MPSSPSVPRLNSRHVPKESRSSTQSPGTSPGNNLQFSLRPSLITNLIKAVRLYMVLVVTVALVTLNLTSLSHVQTKDSMG